MEKIKNNKAITLIALIITIIILLILAGVAISFTIGENGIFDKSKKAVAKYEEEAKKEQEELENIFPKTISDEVTVANYGDYVDYGIDLNGDGDTKNDWRIFYKDNVGRVFIISADYVPINKANVKEGEKSELKQAMENSSNVLIPITDSNYKDYCLGWESVSDPGYIYTCNDGKNDYNKKEIDGTAHSQCSFPEVFQSTQYYCSDHIGADGKSGYANSRCVSKLQCTNVWSPFVNGKAQYAIGGPTIEMWIASWNQKHGDTDDNTKALYCGINTFGYNMGVNKNSLKTSIEGSSYYGSEATGYGDDLYFIKGKNGEHTGNLGDKDGDNSDEYCGGYWIASPSAEGTAYMMYVGTNGKISYGGYAALGTIGVRPVVCLKSDNTCKYDKENKIYTLN